MSKNCGNRTIDQDMGRSMAPLWLVQNTLAKTSELRTFNRRWANWPDLSKLEDGSTRRAIHRRGNLQYSVDSPELKSKTRRLGMEIHSERGNTLWNPATIRRCLTNGYQSELIANETELWNRLWKIEGPEKFRILLWRICTNILSVTDHLITKGEEIENLCSVCSEAVETTMHFIFECSKERETWHPSPLNLDTAHWPPMDAKEAVLLALHYKQRDMQGLFAALCWGIYMRSKEQQSLEWLCDCTKIYLL